MFVLPPLVLLYVEQVGVSLCTHLLARVRVAVSILSLGACCIVDALSFSCLLVYGGARRAGRVMVCVRMFWFGVSVLRATCWGCVTNCD